MNVLFVHQNFPGQYKHLAPALAADPANAVAVIADEAVLSLRPAMPGVKLVTYALRRPATAAAHRYVQGLESGVQRGLAAAAAAVRLRDEGFVPDVICAHPGWGEALYLKDVFPRSLMLSYFEFYYRPQGSDVGFDPEFPPSADDRFRVRTKNSVNLLSLEASDWGIAPTEWQRRQFPAHYRDRISVVHDGIDTEIVKPRTGVGIGMRGNGLRLTAADEVVTFVNRNLEPYRGFHAFMRALPELQRRRPEAQVVIVGGDEVSYGRPPAGGRRWRPVMLEEVGSSLDLSRVHFTGRIPYADYLALLQVSAVHVYLTYPFVLSWSMLEAMAAGCLVVGSRTPPVEEVIEHGRNGLLVDFFRSDALVEAVERVLNHPDRMRVLREAARNTIRARYDLRSVCLPRQVDLIRALASRVPVARVRRARSQSYIRTEEPIMEDTRQEDARLARLEEGRSHQRAGQLAEARAVYESLLQRDSDDSDALHLLGLVDLQEGRAEAAAERIGAAIRLKSDDPAYQANLGTVYRILGRHEQAIKFYQQALALDPRSVTARTGLGLCLLVLGRIAEAETTLRAAVAASPRSLEAQVALGSALQSGGKMEEAEIVYLHALTLNPGHPETLNALGGVLQARGKAEEAILRFQEAIKAGPPSVAAHLNLASLLQSEGRTDEAIEHLRQAVSAEPRSAEAIFRLSLALRDCGRVGESLTGLREALAIDPDHDRAIEALLSLGAAATVPVDAARRLRTRAAATPRDARLQFLSRTLMAALVPQWRLPSIRDTQRNAAYAEAIRRAMRSDARVLDIGAGSGWLAAVAARSGAAHVTACESSPLLAAAAQMMLARSGVADRVAVLSKPSTDLVIGRDTVEAFDLIVFEPVSGGLFDQSTMATLQDAHKRLLAPGGRIIPEAGEVLGALVGGDAMARRFFAGKIDDYELCSLDAFLPPRFPLSDEREQFQILSEPETILTIAGSDAQAAASVVFRSGEAGPCCGILTWVCLELGPEIRLTNDPRACDDRSGAWEPIFHPFPEPLYLQDGAQVTLSVGLAPDGVIFGVPERSAGST